MFSTISDSLKSFFEERMTATLWVSITAIVVDISHTLIQRRIKQSALVTLLENGHQMNNDNNKESGTCKKIPSAMEKMSLLELDRCDETQRVTRQMTHRGTLSLVMQNTGSGVTTLMKKIARSRPSTLYVSFENVVTIAEMCVVLRRELGIEADEKLPLSFFVASKMLRGASGILGGSDDGSSSGGENGDDDGSDDDTGKWRFEEMTRRLTTAAEQAYRRNRDRYIAKQQQQQQVDTENKNTSYCSSSSSSSEFIQSSSSQYNFDAVPLIIFDDCTDLDEKATAAIASFAHNASGSGYLFTSIVVETPYSFFASKFAHSVKVISPKPPSQEAVAEHILSRCPFLPESSTVARKLVDHMCGRNIGVSNQICTRLEELLCDHEVSIKHMSPEELIVLLWKRSIRQYAFAVTRSFHLYSLQPTKISNVIDEERLSIFRISILLLDKIREVAQEQARKNAASATSTSSPCTIVSTNEKDQTTSVFNSCEKTNNETFDAKTDFVLVNLPYQVSLNFQEVLTVCPLSVMLRMIQERRAFLPFHIFFDHCSFRSPIQMYAMREVVGVAESPERERALKELEKLQESLNEN